MIASSHSSPWPGCSSGLTPSGQSSQAGRAGADLTRDDASGSGAPQCTRCGSPDVTLVPAICRACGEPLESFLQLARSL